MFPNSPSLVCRITYLQLREYRSKGLRGNMWHFAVNQRRDADETQKTVTARSHRIVDEQKECKKLEELARADLATVEPALNEATKVCIPRSNRVRCRVNCPTRISLGDRTKCFKNSLLILSVSLDTQYHHVIPRHPRSLPPVLNSHSARTQLSSPISSSPAVARGIRISFRRSFTRTRPWTRSARRTSPK